MHEDPAPVGATGGLAGGALGDPDMTDRAIGPPSFEGGPTDFYNKCPHMSYPSHCLCPVGFITESPFYLKETDGSPIMSLKGMSKKCELESPN